MQLAISAAERESLEPAEVLALLLSGAELPEEQRQLEAMFADMSNGFGKEAQRWMQEAIRLGEKPACRGKGCSWCCYDAALVNPLEVLILMLALERKPLEERLFIKRQLARWILIHTSEDAMIPMQTGAQSENTDAFHDNVRKRTAKTVEASMKFRTPCPFLIDGACSVYASRPIACRGHHSLNPSPDDCKDKNEGKTSVKSLNLLPLLIHVMKHLQANGIPIAPAGDLPTMLWIALGNRDDLETAAALQYEERRMAV